MPGLSNWREEFNLSEVVTGKMTDKEALKKVSEKSGINNKVTINPKLDEAVKEIGGEVIGMVEQDTTAQKQRIDMKQMILDRQKLKLRRKDLSAAKKEKKEGEEGESTNATKQANVIAQEETEVKEGVMKMVKKVMSKKKPEKKAEKAMDAGARARRILQQKDHEKVNFLPMDEGNKKGLWDNIHAKRERIKSGSGEKKAKPGDKDYPKTLNVEDKAFEYVKKQIAAKYGKSGYVSKDNPRKPQTAAEKAKVAAHNAKLAKQDHRDPTEKASDGRYSDRYSNRGSD